MQINRRFEIIYILLEKKCVTAKDLADRFEVSTRTIYRDVEALSESGVPIYMSKGKGGGISLLEDFVLNKTLLTDDEKRDILSAIHTLDAVNFNLAGSTVNKISTLFGKSNSEWIEIDFSSWYNADKEMQVFNDVKKAILSHNVVRFSYSSQKEGEVIREVEPLRICFKGTSRYLYAYCRKRNDYRFFKLNRIKDLIITEQEFNRTVSGKIFNDQPIFKEETAKIKMKFSSEIAYRIYDEFENIIQNEDGSFIVESEIPMGEWFFPYIFSFGRHLEVIEPVEIRELIEKEVKKIYDTYKS